MLKAADPETPERVQLYVQRAPDIRGAWARGLAPASPQVPGPQSGCRWHWGCGLACIEFLCYSHKPN